MTPTLDELRCTSQRIVASIGTDDVELVLAALGFTVSDVLLALPFDARMHAARTWIQTLAATLCVEADDGRRVH